MYKQQHSGQPAWASHLRIAWELEEYLSFMNTDLVQTRLNSVNLCSHIHMGWAKSHLQRAKPPTRPSSSPACRTLSKPVRVLGMQASETPSDTIISCWGDEQGWWVAQNIPSHLHFRMGWDFSHPDTGAQSEMAAFGHVKRWRSNFHCAFSSKDIFFTLICKVCSNRTTNICTVYPGDSTYIPSQDSLKDAQFKINQLIGKGKIVTYSHWIAPCSLKQC